MRLLRWIVLAGLVASVGLPETQARTASDAGFTDSYFVQNNVFNDATGLAWAPDGSNRLFVALKGGAIKVIKNGSLLGTNFHSFSPYTGSECGVVGICFYRDTAASTTYLYAFVTVSSSEQQIWRLNANGDTSTGATLIKGGLPTVGANHDGGGIGIGPDNKLYWSIGDQGNGTGVDLDLSTLAAKVGRSNLNGSDPGDNPFRTGGGGARDFMYARGFRNPFTMTFHPTTGDLWLNVVGTSFEQIFRVARADHGGWNNYEGGSQPAGTTAEAGLPGVYIDPQLSYPTASGGGGIGACVTGGTFYTGTAFPTDYRNNFFFCEYHSNYSRIYRVHMDGTNRNITDATPILFASSAGEPVDIEMGPDEALYYVGRSSGGVKRISYTATTPQNIVLSRSSMTITEGSSGTFTARLATAPTANVTVTVTRTGDTDVSVSATPPLPLVFTPSNWSTPQTVTVAAAMDADTTSDTATITCASSGLTSQTVAVTVNDTTSTGAPTAVIASPVNGQVVSGTSAEFYGNGTDNVAPVRAEFYVDGVLGYTDNTPPTGMNGHYHFNGGHAQWDTTAYSDGTHTLRMRVYDGGGLFGEHTITVTIANGISVFQQGTTSDAIVAMEAENYNAPTVPQGGHDWTVEAGYGGYSGAAAMHALPDSGANINTGYAAGSPRLDFAVNFSTSGTHYVWLRGMAPSGAGSDDSVHVGLDGAEISTSDRIFTFGTTFGWSNATMDGPVATIDVTSPGVHIVNVWMREDGFVFDKLLLTVNSTYAPTGTGPAESARIGGGGAIPSGGGGGGKKRCGATGFEALLALLVFLTGKRVRR